MLANMKQPLTLVLISEFALVKTVELQGKLNYSQFLFSLFGNAGPSPVQCTISPMLLPVGKLNSLIP